MNSLGENIEIDKQLFKDEAYRGERTSLIFRWILVAVVMAFILVTFLRGDQHEALLSFIPAGIFLFYNLYLTFQLRTKNNFYFLRYFSVSVDIIALSIHIYINSHFFSPIAVSTAASIFIYPVLMFLSVLRYDKKLIIYATLLTITALNINYFLQFEYIQPELMSKVLSSDPMGQVYKSAYILLLGVFFLKVPELLKRSIARQKGALEERNEYILNLLLEKKEKELLKTNFNSLSALHDELKTKSNKIEEQNEKLNELVKTKDKLISFISHDLKNSFSTMASIIETSKENINAMDTEDLVQAMDILYNHSVNNHILFENLLQWAKLQRGQLPLNKEKINLHEFCLKSYKTNKEQLDAKELQFKVNIPDDVFVFSDRTMLCSVCNNLLGNAVKFTPRGGKISINAKIISDKISITIEDTGVGISKERLPEIFSITKSTKGTEGEKGSGFGLILCQELINRNGGEITVNSEEGKGTCFTINLPGGSATLHN
jgi:signal transduction histidine kinase